jgi:CDP-glucose 4,6-dehydratase
VASTDKAYGAHEKLPYTEDYPLNGIHPYDVSKVCTDLLAQSYAKTYNLSVVITRCGNIFGPGDYNFNRIIPAAIRAAINDEILEIRSDGLMIRDYIYVKDIVEGYMLLAENIDTSKGEAYNLATGEKYNVLQIVDEVSKAIGKKVHYKILNTAKNEIPSQYLSGEKIQKQFGWKPRTLLVQALKETYNWYKGFL